MKCTSFLFAALLMVARLVAAPGFPHDSSDLVPDPGARFGRLPNGVRYVVYPNKEPQGRASLRLLVQAGSLMEEENQRGVAHFLEHMSFNGSTHYAPGTLVEFFQRMGMSFGGDTNAYTAFDHTLYMLELPKTDSATLAEGLRVFGDYAGGLLLLQSEIDRERGVIMSEKRARDSVEFRTTLAQFQFMLGQMRMLQRIPIGVDEVIEHAPRERFTAFWDTWYRPERIIVVAVGDFEAAPVEQQIIATFSPLVARAPARPEPDLGGVPQFYGVRTHFHHDPEATETSVIIANFEPFADGPDTAATRLKLLPRELALAMLNRRLAEIARKEDSPFSNARAEVSSIFRVQRQFELRVTCKPGQWAAALAVAEQELRRAQKHGFLAEELKEAVANYRNDLDQGVKTASTRRSNDVAQEIANRVMALEVFTSPAATRDLMLPALAKVTAADCRSALGEVVTTPGRFVMVASNTVIPGDADAAIATAYENSRATAVAAASAKTAAEWGYSNWGEPGKVVKREHVSDLDLELVAFANGVKLNLKKTSFEAGRIRAGVRVGYGIISQPPGQGGLSGLARGVFLSGGLGKHPVEDFDHLFAGKSVGVKFDAIPDAFLLSGEASPDDLLLQLQLMAAHLTDPGWRPDALRMARLEIGQAYASFKHIADGPLSTSVARLLAGGDDRFCMPENEETMQQRTLDEIKAWLTPQFTRGPLEISLVGDLDIEATITAVAQTFGALPPRDAKADHPEMKKLKFPSQPFNETYTLSTDIPKGNVLVYWPTSDGLDVKRARRLFLLSNVLNDRLRLKIRHQMGGTYSPQAASTTSDVVKGYGFMQVECVVNPAQAGQITDMILAIGQDLAANGVTEDEINRARQPLLNGIKESLRNNIYWSFNVLSRAQERPEVLEWTRTRVSDVESVTAAELSELAKTYLGRERASRVTILPAPATSAKPTAP